MWYIFNKEHQAVATCNQLPNLEDLKERQEYAVESDRDIPVSEAIYENGDIVRRVDIFKMINPFE